MTSASPRVVRRIIPPPNRLLTANTRNFLAVARVAKLAAHSGGPIFAFWDDGPYVVAVVSAEGDDDNNYCAGGSWLPELVQQARTNDP